MNANQADSLRALVAHALHGPGLADDGQRALATRVVLDTLAVGVAGASAPFAAPLRQLLPAWGQGGPATLLGAAAGHWPAPSAAFVNAYQIHGSEYDYVHEPAVVHPMAATLAAALAAWQARSATEPRWRLGGRAWLDLVSRAVDVAIAVGLSARQGLRFFRPATAGAFGAMAAVCQIRGHDEATASSAFGHLYSQLCGTMQAHAEGTAVLPMQIGFNARNALVAADLAEAGISAPAAVFEGTFGYLNLYEAQGDLGPSLAELAVRRRIVELSCKPFPTGRATHGGIDGILRLRAAHAIEPARVREVQVWGPPLIARLVGRRPYDDFPAHYARLCMAYVGAVALRRGHVDLADFVPEALRDPDTLVLAARIGVCDDGNPDPNALLPQRVEITLDDGSTRSCALDAALGSRERPLADDAHWAKLRHCLDFGGLSAVRQQAFIAAGGVLGDLADVAALLDPVLAPLFDPATGPATGQASGSANESVTGSVPGDQARPPNAQP
ncbi:MAG: MmgE/PrpD family protein [Burkholderiaceae bacterium]